MKDADAVRNLRNIVAQHKDEDIFLVVSAMGKTTNELEIVLKNFREHHGELGVEALSTVINYHKEIMRNLFDNNEEHPVFESVTILFADLMENLQRLDLSQEDYQKLPYDYQYDQTVCYGELISTTIISAYLNSCGICCHWLDAREYVRTDDRFRAASPDWDETRQRISKLNDKHVHGEIFITQGFIGSTVHGKHTVTLGREGSDFTAAIFANCLDAEEVTIWKDVDGLLNADPKRFDETVQLPHITYSEAIELAFYGASVIHPKTIKPLQNKGIKLKVQSFLNPDHTPSVIDSKTDQNTENTPSYILKDNQTLVSISPHDYSFMNEHNLCLIFNVCDQLNIHANVIQTSALMLSFCFDHDDEKLKGLRAALRETFQVKYNEGLTLFTIRHYDNAYTIGDNFLKGKKVLLKQSSRSTLQYVIQ